MENGSKRAKIMGYEYVLVGRMFRTSRFSWNIYGDQRNINGILVMDIYIYTYIRHDWDFS